MPLDSDPVNPVVREVGLPRLAGRAGRAGFEGSWGFAPLGLLSVVELWFFPELLALPSPEFDGCTEREDDKEERPG